MIDDEKNIDLIVEIINKKKSPTEEMNFKIESQINVENAILYKVSIYSQIYDIYIPPATLLYNGKKIKIYRIDELSDLLNELSDGDNYLKNTKIDKVYSIKDSRDLIVDEFIYGIGYEIIQRRDLSNKSPTFHEFLNIINFEDNFPKNCKYYNKYCDCHNDFKYVSSQKRNNFESIIVDFIKGEDYKRFITGQRGIGKTTTVLNVLYQKKYPFFYINVKYFLNSLNDLEKKQIMDFERSNLFRPISIKLKKELKNKLLDYGKEFHNYLDKINNFIYNDTKISKIKFISMIIQILILIYKHLKENEINSGIEIDINKVIDKIKILNISEKIIEKDLLNSKFLLKSEHVFKLIDILLRYKAYLTYCEYNLEYNVNNNIWDFIQKLLKETTKLELEFVLILDQYKNQYSEEQKLNQIFDQYKNSKILICSSIDDYGIRKALINGLPNYIKFRNELITISDIKNVYKYLFENISEKKKKYVKLFNNNIREVFDCLFINDDKLDNYIKNKIDKIVNYLKNFCAGNISNISYINFLFRNIHCLWENEDYTQINSYIPFKYFTSERIILSDEHTYNIGKIDENKNNNKEQKVSEINNEVKETNNELKQKYYHKFNYSMPIVGNALFKFFKNENNIESFENIILTSNKGSLKGTAFEEYIKSKISKSLMNPINNIQIDKTIEIWSLFSESSKTETLCLFEGKLEDNKIYFIDIRNQIEQMFDCAFIDLIRNEITFTQITISKKINKPIFDREKIKEKGKEAIEFLKENFIDKDIEFNIKFFFIFLKFIIDEKNEEDFDDSRKDILSYMNDVNEKLEQMKNKCEREHLKYCVYNLYENLSDKKKQQKIPYNIIDSNDINLYILKNKDSNNIEKHEKNLNKSLSKKKRSHLEMSLSQINLIKIDLKLHKYINLFYIFYVNKFKLEKKKLYREDNITYTFKELLDYFKALNCFALLNKIIKKDDYNNIIYYDTSDNKITIENINNKIKNKNIDEAYKNQNFNLYFLGNKDDIKINIAKVKNLDSENNFGKKKIK